MPSEILSGEVYQKDAAGEWKLILTSWGVPVVDNRTESRYEQKYSSFFAADSRVYWNSERMKDVTSIRFPYSGA